MKKQQTTLSEILLEEHQLVANFPHKDEDYFKHAIEALNFFQSFFVGMKHDGWLFAAFLSQVRKHHLLALLSVMRKHHVQAMMNLRQVLESGVNAGYALANPNTDDFAVKTATGLLTTSSKLQKKRYDWIEENYSVASKQIKVLKKSIQHSTHSNIVDAHRNFKFISQDKSAFLDMPFFDQGNEFQLVTDFWLTANIVIGLTDMFYGINQDCKVLKLADDFQPRLLKLQKNNDKIKARVMETDAFKRADANRQKNSSASGKITT